MDFTAIRARAEQRLPADIWSYFQGTAGVGDLDRDADAWRRWDLVPRVLTELEEIDARVRLGGVELASPLVIAPTAAQGACDPAGELATRRAAAKLGLLAGYSSHATIEVERFADAAEGPWWAQSYVTRDRAISERHLRRCAAAGASAIVVTVDMPGELADAPFRRLPLSPAIATRGNYDVLADGTPAPLETEWRLGPDELRRTAEVSGLPVWAKGIMTAVDAHIALDAGAAGVWVSNHGRRQLDGVAPTAAVLRDVAEGVNGRAPIIVDGGIRSGADVARALALGASAAAVGRPVPWALAAGGEAELEDVLATLADEVRVAMAGLGAGSVAAIGRGMAQPAR